MSREGRGRLRRLYRLKTGATGNGRRAFAFGAYLPYGGRGKPLPNRTVVDTASAASYRSNKRPGRETRSCPTKGRCRDLGGRSHGGMTGGKAVWERERGDVYRAVRGFARQARRVGSPYLLCGWGGNHAAEGR